MASSDQIFADAEARRREMQAVETDLDQQARNAARRRFTEAGLTDQQKADLETEESNCRQQIIDLNNEMERLAYATLARLNDAAELDTIRAKVREVIAGLQKVRRKIERHGQIANKVTTVLTGIEKLQGQLEDIGLLGNDSKDA
jgi:hypothetical protein